MASFQAKIGWKRRRKRENKNCISVPFLPDGKYKIPKKEKKNKKIKKYHCGFISCQNRLEKAEKKKKIVFPFPSDRTRNRKFQKKRI